jgi:hypothetical protein
MSDQGVFVKGQIWGHGPDGPPFKVDGLQDVEEADRDAKRRTEGSKVGFFYWVEHVPCPRPDVS